MWEFFSGIFTKEVVTIIIVQFFSLLAIIFNNKHHLKQVKIQRDTESKKYDHEFKREGEKNRLNTIYKPIIRMYKRAESDKNMIDNFHTQGGVIGDGINAHSREKIEKIIESNLHLMKISDIVRYENALNEMHENEMTIYKNILSSMDGLNSHCYLFDENKEFIDSIKEEARRIEKEIQ